MREFVSEIREGRHRIGVAKPDPFVGPTDSVTDDVIDELRIGARRVADHVPGQVLQKRDLLLRRRLFPLREIPGIERLVAVEVYFDDPAAHEFYQRAVGVAALQDGNLRADPAQHEQQQLGHEGLSPAALGHDQHVGVAQACIEWREGHHLARGSFEQNRSRGQSLPRNLCRQQVRRVQRKALLLPFGLLRHPRERPDVNPFLRERLRNTARSIHSSYRMQDALTTVRENSFRFLPILRVPDRVGRSEADNQTEVAHLQRTGHHILQSPDQLILCDLRLDIDFEAAMNVSLRRLHAEKPPFIRAHDPALIRNRDFRANDKRKLLPDQFAGDTGECGVRHFLDADPGVEQTADFQIVVLFVLDIDIRDLCPCAFVSEPLTIRPPITQKRIHRPLDLEKHFLVGHAPRLHPSRFERRLGARHQALELRQTILVFPQRSLNALVRRQAPLVRLFARVPPLEIRAVVVDVGVPDEVHLQPSLQVASLLLARVP